MKSVICCLKRQKDGLSASDGDWFNSCHRSLREASRDILYAISEKTTTVKARAHLCLVCKYKYCATGVGDMIV